MPQGEAGTLLLLLRCMKKAKILHNPKAGKQEHTKKKLVSLVKSKGFNCGYSSTKEIGWKKIKPRTDFIVIAGGDGTVRKIVTQLHNKKKSSKNLPILLLPLGTANNIAKSLGIDGHIDDIIKNFDKGKLKKFDAGRITGRKKEMIFLESFGFGIFPELMQQMKGKPEREDSTPEENIKAALEELQKIVMSYPAKPFTVIIDDTPFTDHYMLIEVMNISSIGPNLNLSPDADPGDGEFELIMIPENQRKEFADYISDKIRGIEKQFSPVVIKGKKISIATPAGLMHIDDELKTLKKAKKLTITPEPGMIEFFVQ
jgi:diacylglycerol kinase family enzyme